MAPNQYTIGVTKNKFALYDSEEELDPHELLKKQEKEKEERKKAKVLEKNTTRPVKSKKSNGQVKVVKPSGNLKHAVDTMAQKDAVKPKFSPPFPKRNANFNNRNQSGPKQDNEQPSNLEHYRDRRNHTDNRADGSSGSESGGPDKGRGDMRGFSRVFVRGGGRGRGGFDNGRKREYDRRSGSDKTGVKPMDKRRASGSFNWGKPEDDMKVQVPQEEPKSPEGSHTTEQADKVETKEVVKNEKPAVSTESDEKKALTLDEWKALKSGRAKPSYNIRKPGEGEDLTRWKDMVVLEKKGTDEEEDEEEYEYGEFPQRVGRQKRLEINVRFFDRRGRPGRGRGMSRGSPSASAHRSPPPPRVDDESDFPSLVKAN